MKRSTNTISTTGSTVSFFDSSSGSKDDDDNDVDYVKGDGRDEGEGEGDRDGGETSPTSVCETISQSQREARGVPEENGEIGGHLSPDIVLPGTSPESQYEATDVLCSLPKPGDFSPANQYFGCKANTMIASSGVISPQWGWYIRCVDSCALRLCVLQQTQAGRTFTPSPHHHHHHHFISSHAQHNAPSATIQHRIRQE